MESKLFQYFNPLGEENKSFLSDFKYVLEATPDQLNQVIHTLPEFLKAPNRTQSDPILDKMSTETGLPRIALGPIIRIGNFMSSSINDQRDDISDDSPEAWANDLLSVGIIEEKQLLAIVKFFQLIVEINDSEIKSVQLDRRAESGVLPVFEAMGTTVELRGVFDTVHRLGMPIDNYSPSLVNIVPIISVSLRVDSGDHTHFTFQSSLEDLGDIINKLEAAKKEASILLESCSV